VPKVGYWYGNLGTDGELKLLKWFRPFRYQEIQHFDVPLNSKVALNIKLFEGVIHLINYS